ncbi:hypothetical protein M6B38_250470 [Iris pallida]|nr:hypothetical protein M6B38_250470 [Iris pallida]
MAYCSFSDDRLHRRPTPSSSAIPPPLVVAA